MKQFIVTPEEFAKGQPAMRALDIILGRAKPRTPRRPTQPGKSLPLQVGTIQPADFAAGRPYFGQKRVRGHRQEPVYTMAPLDVVEALIGTGSIAAQ